MFIHPVPDSVLPQVTLRRAASHDDQFMRLVYAESRREELAQMQWPAGALEAFLGQQFEAQSKHYAQHYPDAHFVVIEVDNRPAGRLYYFEGPEEIRILEIALLPEARGRGIGASLLSDLLVLAGTRRVVIHVEKNNRAQFLYLRLGFKLVEDKGVYLELQFVNQTA